MRQPDKTPPRPPRVLTIAGSDSSGGAGIQADIKAITCLGGYAMSAITALTAQNTLGVFGVVPVPPEFVAQQMEVCIRDIGVDAAKTGMLCNAPTVKAVAAVLRREAVPNLVVDPVMLSKSGHRLLDEDAERALAADLLPLATVVTPNLAEAGRLAGFTVATGRDMRRAAATIHRLGPRAVIVKGGHLEGEPTDLLYDGSAFMELAGERIETRCTHGTGCSFSAALATELARGCNIADAALRAKRFITEAIRSAPPLGCGIGPTNPLAAARKMGT